MLKSVHMKQGIHPQYNNITATCVCGGKFATGSTRDEIKVEICSQCHPFYTGKQKLVDTAGRVDKFKSRMEASRKMKETKAAKPAKEEKAEIPAVDGDVIKTTKKEK